jgi:hypothetical protein
MSHLKELLLKPPETWRRTQGHRARKEEEEDRGGGK